MSTPIAELMHGYLDETLEADQQRQLADWLQSSPDHAREFAELVLLHDRLRGEWSLGEEPDQTLAPAAAAPATARRRPRTWPRRWATLVATLAGVVLLTLAGRWLLGPPALAANAELERILQSSEHPFDRVYRVTAVDEGSMGAPPSQHARGAQPPVDGALLYVRGADQYVLVRRFADGGEFITGSDGVTAWSIPPRGRVRVSSDPARFRGAVPGQQHAIPFIDLGGSLRRLRDAYQLSVDDGDQFDRFVKGGRRLVAVRKTTAAGGPKQVTIWYQQSTGEIQSMLLERLPQARGGPRHVRLELVDQRRLDATFFEHSFHHGTDREVVEEQP